MNRVTRGVSRALAVQARYGHMDTFKTAELTVQKADGEAKLPPLDTLQFGKVFSGHMLQAQWTKEGGWEAPKIVPYGNLSLSPAASSLHYGLQCFEGMKAYRNKQDEVFLFRPDMNAKRLNRSTTRLELPSFDNEEFIACLKELIKLDKEWIPQEKGYSLYIRPTVISTDNCLGVAPPNSAMLFIITGPVGSYYSSGGSAPAVKLFADSTNVRAWVGGTGQFKIGGNYAPTIHPQVNAAKKGYSQVLWLGENDSVSEVGAMNMFFVFKTEKGLELVTSPLDGTVLPGVTRDSVLQLAAKMPGVTATERVVTMGEIVERLAKGEVAEAFGSGTAAVVSPVAVINYKGEDLSIPVPEDSLALSLMSQIQTIQAGETDHPWCVKVC